MNFNLKQGVRYLTNYVNQLSTLVINISSFKVHFTNDNEKTTIEGIINNISKNPMIYLQLKNKILNMGTPITISQYIRNLAHAAGNIVSHFDEVAQCGISVRNNYDNKSMVLIKKTNLLIKINKIINVDLILLK